MFRRVAIIGGGAAAASVLGELLARPTPQPLRLDWFTGGNARPARGVAYDSPSARHLLDVRAASISMFAARPRGFLDFLQREDAAMAGTDFVPRHRYGDYLEAEVAHALQQGEALGHHVQLIPVAVDALVPEHDGVTVIHGEQSHRADAAVLALGALPPQPPPTVGADVLASGRYVVDPWPFLAAAAGQRPVPRKVLLVGLGLTAVDVLLELSALWPQARFHAVSRHGVLPATHLHTAAAPPGDGAALVESLHEQPDIRRWLRLLREAMAGDSEWRALIDGLRPHTPALWRALPHEQRARFLRHARWAWEHARHRMAPQVGEQLAALERDGRLQRQRGRIASASMAGDLVRVAVASAGTIDTREADLVIQTTGLATDVRGSDHRLIRQLLTNAHITPDPLGLGVLVDADGRLQHGAAYWPHLFAIGCLRRGSLWESTAMPEIRQQARALADRLLAA